MRYLKITWSAGFECFEADAADWATLHDYPDFICGTLRHIANITSSAMQSSSFA
jgi:hypothetical protein